MSDKYEIYEYKGAFGSDKRVLKNGKAVNEFGLLKDIQKLQAENAELKKQSEWISVDDELPQNDDYVLITDSCGFTAVGYFWPFDSATYRNKNTWYYGDSEQFVTHWMQLPTKPKGE